MILAVIGEELGFVGIAGVLFLYGMIAYAGLRAARMARDLYSKLLAAGITSVILIQATVNFFAVLGVLPLTGVPLPFISYGNSNLVVLLAGMGILINVAQRPAAKARLRVVDGARAKVNAASKARATRKKDADSRDRGRGHRRARGAGAGGRRRAAG
jgi:cell division protein FtsW